MPTSDDRPDESWNLESFLDSLIFELDKAQDTLSVKGINRKLTYTVKDMALDLNVFPEYTKGGIRFTTAKPGEQGASKISLQLGSISDRQIRETTKKPLSADDIAIENIEEIDPEVRESLKKVGINSVNDLERMERQKVNIEKVVDSKAGSGKKVDYGNLANLINKARRKEFAPKVMQASLYPGDHGGMELRLQGENLAVLKQKEFVPEAMLNNRKIEIKAAGPDHIALTLSRDAVTPGENTLRIALDPYAVLSMSLKI